MNGIILINKEKEYTSYDVVAIVKKLTKSKVGHTGTLDPNATGVLPLLIGEATKISKYLINHNKEYEVLLQLGKKTTTADEEGEIIEEKAVPDIVFCNMQANDSKRLNISKDLSELNTKDTFLENVLKQFIGKQQQTPPIYSAIKVNGKKLYEYARQGKQVKIEPRNIEIYSIELINFNKELKQIQFKVKCSKGTYIRSLCEDIAEKLGTVGYMKDLKRTQVGDFYIKDAITINEFKEKLENNDLSNIITIEQIFKNKNEINLQQKYLKQYINGVNLEITKINEKLNYKNDVYRIYVDNKFIGLGAIENNILKRDLVI
ncbi:MAG: tRNA pseudouridine synthase B [Clostridia bacterium]